MTPGGRSRRPVRSETSVFSPLTPVEPWNSIRGWAERKAKLLGLDASTEVDHRCITIDEINHELEDLNQQIAATDIAERARQAGNAVVAG